MTGLGLTTVSEVDPGNRESCFGSNAVNGVISRPDVDGLGFERNRHLRERYDLEIARR